LAFPNEGSGTIAPGGRRLRLTFAQYTSTLRVTAQLLPIPKSRIDFVALTARLEAAPIQSKIRVELSEAKS
jgi:hypothetical protein